ncbi:MAG: glycoside hydrolase family 55 protein [Oscillospiraceae bacterium]|nr:glycoside hydrolase family 55 protein [Oscillospiraceae bacterium]
MEYGKSVFPTKPDDDLAIVFTPQEFGACPDGVGDNTAALQKAIDTLEARATIGIIFIPEGRYRFSGTVNLWRGIRLIGFGAQRPRLFLEDHAAGFEGPLSKYLFFFRNVKPGPGEFLRDANECSFFSSLRNLDIDMGSGNSGAVAARYHIAQLCSIEDCDFYINDAKAAVEFVGNEIERCRFFGGQYGIIGYYTAPGWQFYVGDCVFEGQRRAGIMSSKTGLTLVRDTFRNMPWGVYVPNKELYDVPTNETERLYMENCRAEDIATAVVSMGWLRNPINWLHVVGTVCRSAPMFLECFGYQFVYFFMEPPIEPAYPCYSVETHIGFRVTADNSEIRRKFAYDFKVEEAQWSPVPEPDYRAMPSQSEWVSVRSFGAAGDGSADDTEAFKKAIATADVIYVPQGYYRISAALHLRENTSLVALHPGTTAIMMADGAEGFGDSKNPASIMVIPKGGKNHICGIAIDGGKNPGSHSMEWLGSPESILEDSQFSGDIKRFAEKEGVNAAKPEEQLKIERKPRRKGRDRCHTLWIHDGGAGVFKNIWSNDRMARDGLYIADTEAPGKIYLMSVEHHLDTEVIIARVANWSIISLQTEEAYGDDHTLAMRCEDCEDCVFANLFEYRMQSFEINFPYANHIINCKNMVFWGVHAFSNGPNNWENSVRVDEKANIADREIGTLIVNC